MSSLDLLTGLGIRSDSEGDGNYASPRGSRLHKGVDRLAIPGQAIKAPFRMKIIRVAYPYRDPQMSGIEWRKDDSTGKIFYFDPILSLVGTIVAKGEVIGYAQDVSAYHRLKNMKNHVHFQVDR